MTDITSVENSESWAYQQLAVTAAGMGEKAASSDMARITGHIAVPLEEVSRLLVAAEVIASKFSPAKPAAGRPLAQRLRSALDSGPFDPVEVEAIMALANGAAIEAAPVQQITLHQQSAHALVELAASAPAHRLGGLMPRVVITQRVTGPAGAGIFARIEGMPVESEINLAKARLPILTAPRIATALNSLRSAIAHALESNDPKQRASCAGEIDGVLEQLSEMAVKSIDHAANPKGAAMVDTLISAHQATFEAEWDRVSELVARRGGANASDLAISSADRAALGLALLTVAPMLVDALANGSLPADMGVV